MKFTSESAYIKQKEQEKQEKRAKLWYARLIRGMHEGDTFHVVIRRIKFNMDPNLRGKGTPYWKARRLLRRSSKHSAMLTVADWGMGRGYHLHVLMKGLPTGMTADRLQQRLQRIAGSAWVVWVAPVRNRKRVAEYLRNKLCDPHVWERFGRPWDQPKATPSWSLWESSRARDRRVMSIELRQIRAVIRPLHRRYK